MNELVGKCIDNLEILRDNGGDTFSVIKTNQNSIVEYFKVDADVKKINESEYLSLKNEDKEFYGE